MEAAGAGVAGVVRAITCKRSWDSACGSRRDFIVGCLLAAAAVVSCDVDEERWIQPHLAVKSVATEWWTCKVVQPITRTPLLLGSWLPAVNMSGNMKRRKFRGFGR